MAGGFSGYRCIGPKTLFSFHKRLFNHIFYLDNFFSYILRKCRVHGSLFVRKTTTGYKRRFRFDRNIAGLAPVFFIFWLFMVTSKLSN